MPGIVDDHKVHGDRGQATLDNDHYKRLTSFLEVDHSFLTPWNWNPSSTNNEGGNSSRSSMEPKQKYMQFQPGSFFSYDEKYELDMKNKQSCPDMKNI